MQSCQSPAGEGAQDDQGEGGWIHPPGHEEVSSQEADRGPRDHREPAPEESVARGGEKRPARGEQCRFQRQGGPRRAHAHADQVQELQALIAEERPRARTGDEQHQARHQEEDDDAEIARENECEKRGETPKGTVPCLLVVERKYLYALTDKDTLDVACKRA